MHKILAYANAIEASLEEALDNHEPAVGTVGTHVTCPAR